jgi:hypothetical protein
MSGKIRASGNIMTLTDGNNPTLSLAGKDYCFYRLFYNCQALISAPVLPAATLAPSCYRSMFEGCTGITLYEDGTGPTWGIPAGAQAVSDWNTDMLAGTGGTFTGNPVIGTDYYYTPLPASVDVTINGIELYESGSSGEGWTYVLPTLTLTNAGPFTISGTNMMGQVCVVVAAGVTSEVTLSNLTLKATDDGQCPFALESGANVSLFLAGTNTFASGRNRAGLEVADGRSPSPTHPAMTRASAAAPDSDSPAARARHYPSPAARSWQSAARAAHRVSAAALATWRKAIPATRRTSPARTTLPAAPSA